MTNDAGTVVYGASGGGIASGLSPQGKVLWTKNLTLARSTMAAVTTDGYVLLASGNRNEGMIKIEPATGTVVWSSETHQSPSQAAAIVLDARGVALLPTDAGITSTDPAGNSTACTIQLGPSRPGHGPPGFNSLGSVAIASDGVLLMLSNNGSLVLLA